jgi:hypothetical protein
VEAEEAMSELSAETIRSFRETSGLSVAEAARALIHRSADPLPALASLVRSWKRWEAGTKPSRTYRPLLESLMSAPAAAPAGNAGVTLTGDWWAGWQSSRDRSEVLAVQPVRFRQEGHTIRMWAVQRGRSIETGGYLWQGEMRLWDNEILMGWYAADDGSVRSKGVVYFVLHAHGQHLTGRWVGLSWDGDTVTGHGAMTRTKAATTALIHDLIRQELDGTDR